MFALPVWCSYLFIQTVNKGYMAYKANSSFITQWLLFHMSCFHFNCFHFNSVHGDHSPVDGYKAVLVVARTELILYHSWWCTPVFPAAGEAEPPDHWAQELWAAVCCTEQPWPRTRYCSNPPHVMPGAEERGLSLVSRKDGLPFWWSKCGGQRGGAMLVLTRGKGWVGMAAVRLGFLTLFFLVHFNS